MSTPAGRRVGTVETPRGEGAHRNQRINPRQNKLPMHLSESASSKTA
jgi:hypothetical protein